MGKVNLTAEDYIDKIEELETERFNILEEIKSLIKEGYTNGD